MTDGDLATRAFERILIIKPSSPGDIIHALPVLEGLHRRYPAARIAWLVASPFANLLERDKRIHEIILFDRKRFGRLGRSLSVTGEFWEFVKSLRERAFDLVIDLQGLFRSGFLSMASGAKVRIGFADAREMSPLFYTDKIPASPSREIHAADRNYRLASMLGFGDVPMDFSVELDDDDRAAAAKLLAESGIDASSPFVMLVPATRWETKCWPADRYGMLAAMMHRERGIRSVLVGGPADVPLGQSAVNASQGAAANLCGKTTLRQLAALVERAAIVVTADSTPMHLAAALDRPLVALFGPTSPERTGPYGRAQDVVRIDLECSPCYLKKLSQCPHDHACMQRLDVNQIGGIVRDKLAATRAAEAG